MFGIIRKVICGGLESSCKFIYLFIFIF